MRSALYVVVNDRLGGTLPNNLRTWRKAGVSIRAMARLLEQETGVPVGREAVRSWLAILDESNGEAA